MEQLTWRQMNLRIGEQISEFRDIQSGMHIGLLATTRGGKTTLVTGANQGNGLLSHFEDALVIDSTGDPGYIKDYGKPYPKYGGIHGHRRLSVSSMDSKSREKIFRAIRKAKSQGNIAIYVDELRQIVDGKYFDLGKLLDEQWLFAAKHGVSLIAGTQAPRWLPGAFYDQSKMAFVFGIRDIRTRKRLVEIGGGSVDGRELDSVISTLKRYQFCHIGIDGELCVSKFEIRKPKEEKEPNRKNEIKNVRVIRPGLTIPK